MATNNFFSGYLIGARANCSRIANKTDKAGNTIVTVLNFENMFDAYTRKFQHQLENAIYNLDLEDSEFDALVEQIDAISKEAKSYDVALRTKGVCNMAGWIYENGPDFPIDQVMVRPGYSRFSLIFTGNGPELEYSINHTGYIFRITDGNHELLANREEEFPELTDFDKNVIKVLRGLRCRWR